MKQHLAGCKVDMNRSNIFARHIGAIGLLSGWVIVLALLNQSFFSVFVFAAELFIFFFLPGFLLLSWWRREVDALTGVLCTIIGFQMMVSLYGLARFAGSPQIFYVLSGILSLLGACRLWQHWRHSHSAPPMHRTGRITDSAVIVGLVVMLAVGSSFIFSGRVLSEGMVFNGPMARDHIYHLALIGRLAHVVPPDNFLASGYPLAAYHFFSDLGQFLLANDLPYQTNVLDVYYRLYPSLIFFAIGFLTYGVCARLFASKTAGLVGVALVIFGAGFSWMPGLLQVIVKMADWPAAQERLFTSWTDWGAIGSLYPLVHRPAYYHGLLFLLAGLASLVHSRNNGKGQWVVAGLVWGLMAGFNYTLAASMGIALVIAALGFAAGRRYQAAARLAVGAGCLALASLPANFFILASVAAATSDSAPFAWAPGEFATTAYGWMFNKLGSGVLVSICSMIMLCALGYGLAAVGMLRLFQRKLRFARHGEIAAILAVLFLLCATTGFLLRFEGIGGAANNIIFLQPIGWLLGLFATYPLTRWVRGKAPLVRLAVAGMLLIGAIQGIASFNLGYRIVIEPPMLDVLTRIRQASAPTDVIAFLPDSLKSEKILGGEATANNFYVSALTGLRSYFTTDGYSLPNVPGEAGRQDYFNRRRLLNDLQEGHVDDGAFDTLYAQGVRWVMLPRKVDIQSDRVELWLSGPDTSTFKLLR